MSDLHYSAEAEMSVISALLRDADLAQDVLDLVTSSQFGNHAHRLIVTAAEELARELRPIDKISLSTRLEESGRMESIGGKITLVSLSSYRTKGDWKDHATIVVDKHKLRQLEKCREAMADIIADEEIVSADEKIELCKSLVGEIDTTQGRIEQASIGDICLGIIAKIDEAMNAGQDLRPGVPTGFDALDSLIGRLQPGTLVTIAARPGMGKTAFACRIAINVAKAGHAVHFASMEMSKESLGRRLIAIEGKAPLDLTSGVYINIDQYSKVADGGESLHALPIEINDAPAQTLAKLRSDCRRTQRKYKDKSPLGLVIVDYWQLMAGQAKKVTNRAEELKVIADGLKALSKSLGVAVVLLAQVKQEVEKREDKRPRADDVKDSNAAQEASDVLAFLYRESYGEEKSQQSLVSEIQTAEFLVRKNRNGAEGTVYLGWIPEYIRFTEVKQS